MGRSINCRKCDSLCRCHHPDISDIRFLFFKFRPTCKLARIPKEFIDKNGNITYDDKCKYQVLFTGPARPPKGQSQIRQLGGF